MIMGVVRIGLALGCESCGCEGFIGCGSCMGCGSSVLFVPLGFSWFCFLSLTIKLVSLKIGKILGKLVVSS